MKTKALMLISLVWMLACTPENTDPAGRNAAFGGTIDTYAGVSFGYDGDGGQAREAHLGYITWVSVDAAGNLYITDAAANTIRKVTTSGIISTVAGKFVGFNVNGATFYSGDGGPAKDATMNVPWSVVADAGGNLIISDRGNNVLRKVDAASGKIFTVAGKVTEQGSTGDNGPASQALLNQVLGMALDASGNLYLADTQNHTIRKISTSGQITTIAGTAGQPGYSGDGGQAMAARLSEPAGVVVDASGNVYFSDNNSVVRRIGTNGKISTIAGTGITGHSGESGKATEMMLAAPRGLAIAIDGSILIADSGNNRIRRIRPEQDKMETIAGTGSGQTSRDGGPAVAAALNNPQGIAVDGSGNVYVAESGSSRVRIITWQE